jgi:transcription elongation factor Elf1
MGNCPICKSEALHVMLHSKDFCVSHENFDIVSCSSCGFAFTQNAPDAASIGKYYEHADYVSHTDTKEGLFFKVYHGVRSYMLGTKIELHSRT